MTLPDARSPSLRFARYTGRLSGIAGDVSHNAVSGPHISFRVADFSSSELHRKGTGVRIFVLGGLEADGLTGTYLSGRQQRGVPGGRGVCNFHTHRQFGRRIGLVRPGSNPQN